MNGNQTDVVVQHDCLHDVASVGKETDPYQVISYCLTDNPYKWNSEEHNPHPKLTFAKLHEQNIPAEQLYLWSAPIYVIERYQLYLNQLSASNDRLDIASDSFYNCTPPRFGPFCQYSLDIPYPPDLSLSEIIYDFYQQEYKPTTLTCYKHLECHRGSAFTCLDWSEICDGTIDCLNDGMDEKNCWQLELNECTANEHRCDNGQCIPRIFLHDDLNTFECIDRSDETRDMVLAPKPISNAPTFATEDIACTSRMYGFQITFTSSCVSKRDSLIKKMTFIDTPNLLSDICWLAFKCALQILDTIDRQCSHLCLNKTCRQIVNETCPDFLVIPAGALAFGHMYLAYERQTYVNSVASYKPHYVCYNDQLCGGFYSNRTLLTFNDTTCRRLQDFPITFLSPGRISTIDMYFKALPSNLYQCNTIILDNTAVCNSSTMYRCINSSKCISKYRLCDGKNDCDYKDDEYCPLVNGSCATFESNLLFQCTFSKKCISFKMVDDRKCDCDIDEYGLCGDEPSDLHYIRKQISFPTICDGFTELIPVSIGRNETDETECEYWECNNTYTRCDGFWNCFDGADEIDCDPSPLLKCPSHHHLCISLDSYQLICLPIEKANDGNIDCLGATDEPKLCRSNDYRLNSQNFYCRNDTNHSCVSVNNLCYTERHCAHGDDQFVCDQNRNSTTLYNVCIDQYASRRTKVQSFLCGRSTDENKLSIVHFSLGRTIQPITPQIPIHRSDQLSARLYDHRCHRGLPIRIWSNNDGNSSTLACLCPPSFYGDFCQYQNQRVSLTIRLGTYSHSRRTLFTLTISLIDDSDERIIHSSHQITYLYIQHCRVKFNTYLLYSNRPKVSTKNYFIHIDIYEKISFAYRGSLLIPLDYPFLPVHRIAVQVNIPSTPDTIPICSDQKCIHGRCFKYADDSKDTHFCQCDPGWTGRHCNIQYICTCSSDSLCVGVSADNRSICICPLNKWGPRCLLRSTYCQLNQNISCQNGGHCIATDETMISDKRFICICPKGFSGNRCEKADNTIVISFHTDIILPQSILLHFIRLIDHAPPENGSTYKTLSTNQSYTTIRWSRPFHIAFVELLNSNYYLITVQKIFNQSSIISKIVNPSDRCLHINEVLNETIVNFHPLRRIKYYHLPCQRHSPSLSCFYDDGHFCLCNDFGHRRIANCFEFNSSMKHDCFGQSNCENGAQCLQDRPTCPQTSICVCPKCFFGSRCQFSSSLFGLSLDAILGHHIQPHVRLKHQPSIVQVSVALTTILSVIGLVNGLLSLITFKNTDTQKVGCGLYLLYSSIITLLIVLMFSLKFSILIIVQLAYTTNQLFLRLQCASLDFLLRVCLAMNQWLSACVAIERVFTVTIGVVFNKKKSRQMAKLIIPALILLLIGTSIHDPIHRRVLYTDNGDEENRSWCIVSYSSSLQVFNTVIDICHFSVPFIINIISAIIIIAMTTRQRFQLEKQQVYRHFLQEQIRQHYHLLVAPMILIALALPRLIIAFFSSCIDSTSNSWLFLIGYFLSFLPPMVTFIVFVFPSGFYRKQLRQTLKYYQQAIRLRVNPTS